MRWLSQYTEAGERFLRLDRLVSASDLFKARTVYVTAAVFLIVQIPNAIHMYFVYGGWILDHTLLMVALILVCGSAISLRWQANFDAFSMLWGTIVLLGVCGTALPSGVGINSALLPLLVAGVIIVAVLGSLRSLLTYCVCSLLLVACLHINAGQFDIQKLSDPDYVALRNTQRSMQAVVAIIMVGAIMASLVFTLDRLFRSLEARASEAQQMATAKTQFLADMSHELRTPLNGVLGMNQLLLRSELDDTQKRYADIINDCGSGMITVIDDILDLSRLDAGRIELKPTAFNPAKMLDSIMALHQANASAKDVRLRLTVEDGLPDMFMGDHGRLRQIVGNLVSNAVKFTDAGHVSIYLRGQQLNEERWWLNIFVQDSGIGITPERRARIFERFEQAEDGQKNTVRGSGLGLAICKQLVELFGGEISVTSKPGEGSLFCVALPLEPVRAKINHIAQQEELEPAQSDPPLQPMGLAS